MNRNASKLYFRSSKEAMPTDEMSSVVMDEPMLYFFQSQEVKKKEKNESEDSDEEDGISLKKLLEMDRHLVKESIFTNNREISKCDSVQKLEDLIDKLNENHREVDKESVIGESASFFFQIKIIEVIQEDSFEQGKQAELMVQMLDISQRILGQSLRLERQYMTMLNSTISHEMRNPLNSIITQVDMQSQLVQKLEKEILRRNDLVPIRE